MNLTDTLSELTADLVEFEENEPFLRRLFKLEPGNWVDLDCLCDGLDGYKVTLARLKKSHQERVRVTWLHYPDSAYGEGYSLIVFFADRQQWHNIAVYNKERLNQPMAQVDAAVLQVV